jgi:hypothetical protein
MPLTKLTLSSLSLTELKRFVHLKEGKVGTYDWNQVEDLPLTALEQQQLTQVRSHLVNRDTTLMNEATIPLSAEYPTFAIEGIADGVLGRNVAGRLEAPYLVVVEAKRGIDASTPVYQLYGQLLAAARINWELEPHQPQEIFGCYTIGDTWKFLRAEVDQLNSEKPLIQLEYSREYVEKLETETIFRILKTIVSRYS